MSGPPPEALVPAFGALDVLFENATIGLGLFDDTMRPVRLNPRFKALSAGPIAGSAQHMARAIDQGAPILGVALDAYGRNLVLDFHPMPPGPDGRAMGVAVVVTDQTEERAARAHIAAGEARLRQVLDAVSAFALVLDPDGLVLEANALSLGIASLTPSDVRGQPLWRAYWFASSEEAQVRLQEALAKCRAGETVRYRERLRVGPEKFLVMDFQAAPIRDLDGHVFQIVASAMDVTTLADAQEGQALLTAELNHRVKNILAIVRALITQTARRAPTKEALVSALEGRVAAMARSVALVSRSQWTGFGLADVLYEQIEAYGSDRFSVTGPNIPITPKAALTFALITYELLTNAAKYGALSTSEGRIGIAWGVANNELAWSWVERGGPPASTPTETGFGTLLMRNIAEGDLGGVFTFAYEPAGINVTLKTALKNLQAAGSEDVSVGEARVRASPLSGKRVLVVEDSAIIALDIVATLEAAGAHVIGPAPNVESALALIVGDRIDVAMLDLDLGGESSQPVRDVLNTKRIPILTVAAVPAGVAAAVDSAMLPKPFTDQELLAALSSALKVLPAPHPS